jgi:hypothetical protein
VLFVDAAHESSGGRKDFIHKNEDGLLGSELDALSDNIAELTNRQVRRHKILLLVYRADVRLFDLFTNDLHWLAT